MADEFLQMHVFFFLTSLAVVVLTVLLALILYRVLRILKNVEHISKQVSDEADAVKEDIRYMREMVRREGMKAAHVFQFITSLGGRRAKRKAASGKEKEE